MFQIEALCFKVVVEYNLESVEHSLISCGLVKFVLVFGNLMLFL